MEAMWGKRNDSSRAEVKILFEALPLARFDGLGSAALGFGF